MPAPSGLDWPSTDRWPRPDQGGHIDGLPPSLTAVRQWIAEVTAVALEEVILTDILVLRSWSMAAKFEVGGLQAIFKCNRLPLYSKCGTIHSLLADCMPLIVPKLASYRDEPGASWTLFWWSEGQPLEDVEPGRSEHLAATAAAMAKLQMAFSSIQDERVALIPRFETRQIPAMLESLIDRIDTYYKQRWTQTGGAILRRRTGNRVVPVPDDFAERLSEYVPRVRRWVDALTDTGWVDTIVHVDLHPGNIIVDAAGSVRIIDWDQATMGFPFEAIMWLDSIAHEEGWQDTDTPIGTDVKSVYLQTLEWQTLPERLDAWEID